jgi:uncharacterized protein YndB with AHSA1/START domain
MPANDYQFVTHWRVEPTPQQVWEVLDKPLGLPRWWPGGDFTEIAYDWRVRADKPQLIAGHGAWGRELAARVGAAQSSGRRHLI